MNLAFFHFEGMNKDIRQIIPLFLVGAVAGFLMTSSGRLALIKLLGAGAIDPTLGFTFIIVLAVIVEEYFFRGVIFPSLEKFLGGRTNGIVATVAAAAIASFLFATWHIVATNGDQSRLLGEFTFSIFQIFMLKVTGSIATPTGAHFMRNLVTGG
jgi:membrane protease YdiL (CAAX protease family)